MKVEILTLCDAASVEANIGKMYIIGAFDHIWGVQKPVMWPLCMLAARMRFEKIEEGQKRFSISFIDDDGNPVMPTMNVPLMVQVAPNETSAIVQISVIIGQLKLPNFGEYSIAVAIDGRQEASIPLIVRQFPLLPPLQQGPQQPPQQQS